MGYIGESTRKEIAYAEACGKPEEAMDAAETMIQMLQELKAEEDLFPEQEMAQLQDLLERIL